MACRHGRSAAGRKRVAVATIRSPTARPTRSRRQRQPHSSKQGRDPQNEEFGAYQWKICSWLIREPLLFSIDAASGQPLADRLADRNWTRYNKVGRSSFAYRPWWREGVMLTMRKRPQKAFLAAAAL